MTLQSAFKSATGLEIEEGIKKAFIGEWKGKDARFNYYEPTFNDVGWYMSDGYAENESLEAILLDPSFWKALYEAYLPECPCCHKIQEYCRCDNERHWEEWRANMHLFVDRLAEEGE